MYKDINGILEKAEWTDEDIWELVLAFDNLIKHHIKKLLKKYDGRRVDCDDLYQEARLAAFLILKKCRHHALAAAYMARSLPGRMNDIVLAQLCHRDVARLDDAKHTQDGRENGSLDTSVLNALKMMELLDMLARFLTGEDLEIALLRIGGCTQSDLAALYKLTQQAMSLRLKKIGKELGPHMDGWWD